MKRIQLSQVVSNLQPSTMKYQTQHVAIEVQPEADNNQGFVLQSSNDPNVEIEILNGDDLKQRFSQGMKKKIVLIRNRKKNICRKLKYCDWPSSKYQFHGQNIEVDHNSFFIFKGNLKFRQAIVWFVTWKWFNMFMIVIIFANAIMMACQDFSNRLYGPVYVSQKNLNIQVVDDAITIIFIAEMVLKMIAYGFLLHKKSYLRQGWLDFIIIIVLVLDWFLVDQNNTFVKIIRTLRILRPLRALNALESMKDQVKLALKTISQMGRILVFFLFMFMIFAIIGISQFKGNQYSRCRLTMEPILIDGNYTWPINWEVPVLCYSDQDCVRWTNPGQVNKCGRLIDYNLPIDLDDPSGNDQALIFWDVVNFNNFPKAILTIFQCMTMESWSSILYLYMDSNFSTAITVLFFLTIILIGSFFALQLVLGTFIDQYKRDIEDIMNEEEKFIEKKKEKNMLNMKKYLCQIFGVQNQVGDKLANIKQPVLLANVDAEEKIIVHRTGIQLSFRQIDEVSESEPIVNDEIEVNKDPKLRAKTNKFYGCTYKLIQTSYFNFTIIVLIIANTAIIALDDFPGNSQRDQILDAVNSFFVWVFLAEMLIKIAGLGFQSYAKDKYNIFDALVCCFSIIDFTVDRVLVNEDKNELIGSFLKAIRALRILRFLKLARSWKRLQHNINFLYESANKGRSFVIWLLIYLYVYSLFGMQFFANRIRFNDEGRESIVKDPIESIEKEEFIIPDQLNFDSIFLAFQTCFSFCFMEYWTIQMNNHARMASFSSSYYYVFTILFFIGLIITATYGMMLLFQATIIATFEMEIQNKELEDQQQEQVVEENFADFYNEPRNVVCRKKIKKIFKDLYNWILREKSEKKQSKKSVQIRPDFENKPTNEKQLFLHYFMLQQEQTDYENQVKILQGRALFIFGPHNKIRIFADLIINSKWFNYVMIVVVAISSISLVFESHYNDPEGQKQFVLNWFEAITTLIFLLEFILKVVCMGFVACGPDSYLRQKQNFLDFFVVLTTSIDFILKTTETQSKIIKILRVFRTFRAFRPLQLLQKFNNLQLAMNSVLRSMPQISQLLAVMFYFIFLVAILCMQLFKGTMWSCDLTATSLSFQQHKIAAGSAFGKSLILTANDCQNYGGEWLNADNNFDSILQSIICLLGMQTCNWNVVMWQFTNAVMPGFQPVWYKNIGFCWFANILMIFLNLLFVNYFLGVITESYQSEKEGLSLNSQLDKIEHQWIGIQIMSYKANPVIKLKPKGELVRDFMIKVVQNPISDKLFLYLIIANSVLFSLDWYDQSEKIRGPKQLIQVGFIISFTLEAIIKIIALKKKYFKIYWNLYDFIVVLCTWSIFSYIIVTGRRNLFIAQKFILILRLGRIFKIKYKVKAIRVIMETLTHAIQKALALAVLLVLVITVYSIIGLNLFGSLMPSVYENMDEAYVNFNSYGNAMLLLFRCITGEAWNYIMYDCARQKNIVHQCNDNSDYYSILANNMKPDACGSPIVSYIYFYSFILITVQVILNLIISTVVDTLSESRDNLELPVTQIDIDVFTEIWSHYDPAALAYIESKYLEPLILDLARKKSVLIPIQTLILNHSTYTRRFIAQLEIPAHDKLQKFAFYDVLLALSRKVCERYYNTQMLERKKLKQAGDESYVNNNDSILEIEQSFDKICLCLFQKNEEIQKIRELRNGAMRVTNHVKALATDDETFTSKHYIYGKLLSDTTRQFIEKIKRKKLIKIIF